MRRDIIQINRQSSRCAKWGTSILSICILLAIKNAELQLGYQLILVASLGLTGCYLSCQYYLKNYTKVDLLINLQSAIIWYPTGLKLMQVEQAVRFGNIAVLFKFRQQRHSEDLLIFYDSLSSSNFKQLLRYIRWQHPNTI